MADHGLKDATVTPVVPFVRPRRQPLGSAVLGSKRFWASFIVIVVMLAGFGGVVWDLQHPLVDAADSCTVLAVGKSVGQLYPSVPVMINQGGPVLNDIALQCTTAGIVRLNDPDAFMYGDVVAGNSATLMLREYRWLPTRKRAMIAALPTIEPVETSNGEVHRPE